MLLGDPLGVVISLPNPLMRDNGDNTKATHMRIY
jgi:hypothetical protein